MKKLVIQFSILILSLLCCCNVYAQSVIMTSPEDASGGSGSCSTSCSAPQVQDSTTCACSCPATCTPPLLQNSTTCACSCPTNCPVGQVQDSTTCACSCPATCAAPLVVQNTITCACSCPTCPSTAHVQNPTTCACSCPTACTAPKVLDTATCACNCPATPACTAPKVKNSSCVCACPSSCAAPEQTQNTTTCACACPTAKPVLTGGHCCPTGQAWGSAANACCPTARLRPDGICCPTGQVNKSGICCASNQVNSNGHCCPTGQGWAVTNPNGGTPGQCCPTAEISTAGQCCLKTESRVVGKGGRVNFTIQKNTGGICCSQSPVALTNKNGICCASNQVNSSGHCCPTGQAWNSVNNACCPSTAPLANDGSCCQGATPQLTNGICCPTGRVNMGGICCRSEQHNSSGLCCNAGQERAGDVCCKTADITAATATSPAVCRTCRFKVVINVLSGNADYNVNLTTASAPICLKNTFAMHSSSCDDDCVVSEIKRLFNFNSSAQDFTIYFDASCNQVPNTGAICDVGEYRWMDSPIVLLLDSSFKVEDLSKDVRLVYFPIDGVNKNKLVEWKTSSKAPLLVYDPSGEGKITSGYQLFGNWTFGPKKTASLNNQQDAKLWENGFDALASLDLDQNGEISGLELKDLSLWFDENRNAISEEGEVRRVSTLGIRKLFYQGYENNDAAHAVVLKTGFEREVSGKLERGTAVDWFTDASSSQAEYVQKALISSILNVEKESTAVSKSNISEIIIDSSDYLSYKKGAETVEGIWNWKTDLKDVPVNVGMFIISDNNDGTVSGYTITELPVQTSFNATSLGSFRSFKGKAKLEANGSVSFSFELQDESGTYLQSTAKLNSGSDSMSGVSKGIVQSDAAKTKVKYQWIATKMK